jgi:hypothetical protein
VGWRGYVVDDDGRDELLFICPDCVEREFLTDSDGRVSRSQPLSRPTDRLRGPRSPQARSCHGRGSAAAPSTWTPTCPRSSRSEIRSVPKTTLRRSARVLVLASGTTIRISISVWAVQPTSLALAPRTQRTGAGLDGLSNGPEHSEQEPEERDRKQNHVPG